MIRQLFSYNELGRVDAKPNNAFFRQNFTHPALKVLTGDSLPATFCLVYVKFMLENLHIILVSTFPKRGGRL